MCFNTLLLLDRESASKITTASKINFSPVSITLISQRKLQSALWLGAVYSVWRGANEFTKTGFNGLQTRLTTVKINKFIKYLLMSLCICGFKLKGSWSVLVSHGNIEQSINFDLSFRLRFELDKIPWCQQLTTAIRQQESIIYCAKIYQTSFVLSYCKHGIFNDI